MLQGLLLKTDEKLFQNSMDLVEWLKQSRVVRDDGWGRGVRSFIFSKALSPGSSKLQIIWSTALI